MNRTAIAGIAIGATAAVAGVVGLSLWGSVETSTGVIRYEREL